MNFEELLKEHPEIEKHIKKKAVVYAKKALKKAAQEASLIYRSEKIPDKIEERSIQSYWIEEDIALIDPDRLKIEKTKLPKWE